MTGLLGGLGVTIALPGILTIVVGNGGSTSSGETQKSATVICKFCGQWYSFTGKFTGSHDLTASCPRCSANNIGTCN